jgi:hypothetical protein
MQFHRLAVDAHVCDPPTDCDDGLTDLEGSGESDSLNGDVDACAFGHFHHVMGGVSVRAINQIGCTEPLGDRQALVVQINHENGTW